MIKKIKDDKGVEVSDRIGVQRVVLEYFRSVFTSTKPTPEAMEKVLDCLDYRVTPAMNEALLQPFTLEEIVHALKQMEPLKSPGPDDMSPVFYQKILVDYGFRC
ncbi:UNVERIFIED_CONTAM: hypothetical protein Slati_1403100 [Sesamum latifolium]|uniref:Uncharacterized protein n=1 Tax=Sesamum latifolium TaxID=2727402 RepID=A0AAW2X4U8_9LAMI